MGGDLKRSLNKKVKDRLAILHTKVQAFEPCGSEEDFPMYFYASNPGPWGRAILDLGIFILTN